MKRSTLILLLILFVGLAATVYFFTNSQDDEQIEEISTQVKKGLFNVHVKATGELVSKRSKKIKGPQTMQSAGIWQTTIQKLVPEGTVVNKGEFVAQLDQTEVANKLNDIQSQIDVITTQIEQTKIDTSIEMRGLRDQIANLEFRMKENKLQVELNKFEPQAVIRQKEIEYEKSSREYDQLEVKLSLTKEKNIAKLDEKFANLKQQETKKKRLMDLSSEFTILAPAEGMVIYAKEWRGKVQEGSQIQAWNPVVAELPDLSEMISKTYVNEVDISKVKVGQKAMISIDAFPDKTFSGLIQSVRSIGEQLKDYDSKVFEVIVSIDEQDSLLRPSMTTGLEILVDEFQTAHYVPLEAIHKDSISYVYKDNGKGKIVKQEIFTGPANDVEILIGTGLLEGEEVLLSLPDVDQDYEVIYLNQSDKDNAKKVLDDHSKEKQKVLAERAKVAAAENVELVNNSSSGTVIVF